MTISPGLASKTLPSTVILSGSAKLAPAVLDVDQELVAEHFDAGHDRGRDRRAEHADGGLLRRPAQPWGDVVAHVEQQVQVRLATLAQLDAAQDLVEPTAALAAGRALPARLPVKEAGDAPRGADHAGGLVHGYDRARAEHGSGLAHRVLVEGHVELVRPEPRRGDATGDERLQLVVVADPAAQLGVVEEVPEGGLGHLDLVVGRPLDVTGDREDPGARRTPDAEGSKGGPAVLHDPGQVRHGLDVVDHGGRAVQALDRREPGRLVPGIAPLALQALQQGRLLAADVGAGARVDHEVDGEVRAEDVAADGPERVRLVDGG